MSWQKAIDKINAEKFKLPPGWDTKEKIANELQCSPDRVHDLLKPGLASGAFESQEFPVWDAKRRMTVRVRCYRQAGSVTSKSASTDPSMDAKIREIILKHPDETNRRIYRRLHRCSAAQVASVRATL